MDYSLIPKEAALMVIIVCALVFLVLVLLIFLNFRPKNKKGGGKNFNEQM